MAGAASAAKRLAKFCLAGLGIDLGEYALQMEWVRENKDSWLGQTLKDARFHPPLTPEFLRIEAQAEWTQSLGARQLWDGYQQDGAVRDSDAVRTKAAIGTFYSWLVMKRQPKVVVEFGTAFGISGMYWLAGLEKNQSGRLFTYEPNPEWAAIASQNLTVIGSRFQLTNGTFEENVDRTLVGQPIDIALIDAIHTSAFVIPQYELVRQRLVRPGLIILDDIDFSDDMRDCWRNLAAGPDVRAALEVGGHIGILEIA